MWKYVGLTKKVIFFTLWKKLHRKKLKWLWLAFWLSFMWNEQILKTSSGSWVIPKNVWKSQKTGFRRNAIIPQVMKIFDSKFDTITWKLVTHFVKFSENYLAYFLSYKLSKNVTVGSVRAGSGRSGSLINRF